MCSALTIEILEVLESSEIGSNMSEKDKTIHLVPLAFELTRIYEEKNEEINGDLSLYIPHR